MSMKLTTSLETLAHALAVVGRALSTRSAIPALGGVMLRTQGDRLTVQATDLEIAITLEVEAQVEGERDLLLPGRLLVDVVRAMAGSEVTLAERSEERDVEITAGSSRFHLRTLAAEDFPRLPTFEKPTLFLPADAFASTVDRVARAASRDEVRPILTGILVQAEGTVLTMAATDSYRLSAKRTELEDEVSESLEANVPARALRELARLVGQEDVKRIEVAPSGNQIVFRAGSVVLSSRLIEGQFPSYRQLIPDSFEHEVKLPREELLSVARRVRHLAQRNVPIRLAFSEGEVKVAAQTPDVGDAVESMPAPFSGEALEIAFNPQFLIEGIESVEGEEILLRLSSPLRPALLRPADGEDFTYLAMPIRLNA